MKHLHIWLAVLLVALAGQVPAYAAGATPDEVSANSICLAHYAEWRNGVDNDDRPRGTYTHIQTCTVGGHQVRINTADWPTSTYHCGLAGPLSTISVWFDGVKAVDNRNTGFGSLCFDPDSNLVSKIIVNDRMHLTVCEALGPSRRDEPYKPGELKPGQHSLALWDSQADAQNYFIEQCSLTTLSPPPGSKDPYFSLRTPPGLILFDGGDAMCPAIQARFAGLKGKYVGDTGFTSSIDSYRIDSVTLAGKPYDTAPEDDQVKGQISQYKLDIDHDGVEDIVTFADKDRGSGMEYPGQYSWTSGKSGASFNVTGAMLRTGVLWTSEAYTDPVRDALIFISAGGKVYLYRAAVGLEDSLPAYNVEQVELMGGAIDGGANPNATRWVYELRPDGTARTACQWRERKRPEEFL